MARHVQRHDRSRMARCGGRGDVPCGRVGGRRRRGRLGRRRCVRLANRGDDGLVGGPDRGWSLGGLRHDVDDRARVGCRGCGGRRLGGLSGGGDGATRRRRGGARAGGRGSVHRRSGCRGDGGRGRRWCRGGVGNGRVGGGGRCPRLRRCGSGRLCGGGRWLRGGGGGLRGGGRGCRWLCGGGGWLCGGGGWLCGGGGWLCGGGRGCRWLCGGGGWLCGGGGWLCGGGRGCRQLDHVGGGLRGQRRWRDDCPADAGADQGRHGLHTRARSVRSKQQGSSHQAPSGTPARRIAVGIDRPISGLFRNRQLAGQSPGLRKGTVRTTQVRWRPTSA
jgi:hypothetical protein